MDDKKTMNEEGAMEAAVDRFHTKVGAPAPRFLRDEDPNGITPILQHKANRTNDLSEYLKALFASSSDVRALRGELILEEAAEALEALASRDEVQLLDALADLMYVTIGTAVAYGLPIEAAFWEVHRSNMSKGSAAATHSGDRGKGPGYSPPDLRSVLADRRGE